MRELEEGLGGGGVILDSGRNERRERSEEEDQVNESVKSKRGEEKRRRGRKKFSRSDGRRIPATAKLHAVQKSTLGEDFYRQNVCA